MTQDITKNKNLTVPVAIVVAGALIAGALYLTNRPAPVQTNTATGGAERGLISPVSPDDYILGNPDAKVVIVEYSDFECPFCKNFHNVLNRIIDEYGPSGNVAWVYRHFPIAQLHSKAQAEAEASECAGELGGNQGFWDYADRLFEVTPSNNGLNLAQLPQIAEDIGLDRASFEACIASGRHAGKIKAQYDEVISAGGRGTPHTVILWGDQQAAIEGAQPYEAMKQVVESLLTDAGVQSVPAVR